MNFFKKIMQKYYVQCALATMLLLNTSEAFASSLGDAGLTGGTATVNWPWRRFLNSVVEELTGPLPLTFGILGIAGACFMAMSGNRGQFSTQLIGLIFAISIVLFAPTFVNIISASGAALTIMP